MNMVRLLLVSAIATAGVGCRQTPERTPVEPETPRFYAMHAAGWQCEIARAFAERDYVRDLLEPEATITGAMDSGDTGRNPSGPPSGGELRVSGSAWAGTITLRDRAPLPTENCPALPGQRLPLRDFLDGLQSEMAKVPPGVRINSITYRHVAALDRPETAKGREGAQIIVTDADAVTFRLKQPPQPTPAPTPAR